jgi:uncharacterized protein YcfL
MKKVILILSAIVLVSCHSASSDVISSDSTLVKVDSIKIDSVKVIDSIKK